ncbi:MAG: L-serine ammonia-lyase, iron-sulfur-dependent, subunit beta [Erysipelothrix sp.]|nr:L-serine ammonia-lyase, iron-sulfur-dependent, subunit beta [Erysipelothrix sp.]
MKKKFASIFDIIGPVMVGPSSSHTAGAVRIGNVARAILNSEPTRVLFYLFGSFADTYKGHGTDVALAAGILGLKTDDSRIPSSLLMALEKDIDMKFIPLADEVEHPNTVRIIMYTKDDVKMVVEAISIGGGNIQITMINDIKLLMDGGVPNLLILHKDTSGMIAKVATILSDLSINIATMKVDRVAKGGSASMIIELDQETLSASLKEIEALDNVDRVIYIPKQLGGASHD